MKTPIYKSYEDLPLYLNAETISKALGIAISSAYELMQEKDFPTFKVGSRKLVEKKSSASGWTNIREAVNEIQSLSETGRTKGLFPRAE